MSLKKIVKETVQLVDSSDNAVLSSEKKEYLQVK